MESWAQCCHGCSVDTKRRKQKIAREKKGKDKAQECSVTEKKRSKGDSKLCKSEECVDCYIVFE